jgi:hypothetical protein
VAVAKVGSSGVVEIPTTTTSWTSAAYALNASAVLLTLRLGYQAFNGGASTPGAVSWNGVAMTLQGTAATDADTHEVAIYTLVNPATGSHTFTATWTHDTGGVMCADGWSGVNTTTPTAGWAKATSTAVSPANLSTAASAVSGDITIDILAGTFTVTFTDDASPSVQDANQAETFIGYCKIACSNTTATGTVATAWTFTGTQSTARAVVILKASAGGAAVPLKRNSALTGLGASGGFFQNPLNAPMARMAA